MLLRAAFFNLFALAGAAAAQESVGAAGQLSDADFYRLVACAAPPGGDCAKPFVRWEKPALTVAVTRMDRAFLGGKKKRAEVALELALKEINGTDAKIRLVQDASNREPDIALLFIDMPAGSTLENTGFDVLDGTPISAAGVRLFAKQGKIERAVVIVTKGLQKRAYESVILEELVQALGLMTDVDGAHYESRSIFSQTSNSLKKLGLQDVMALERHYPSR